MSLARVIEALPTRGFEVADDKIRRVGNKRWYSINTPTAREMLGKYAERVYAALAAPLPRERAPRRRRADPLAASGSITLANPARSKLITFNWTENDKDDRALLEKMLHDNNIVQFRQAADDGQLNGYKKFIVLAGKALHDEMIAVVRELLEIKTSRRNVFSPQGAPGDDEKEVTRKVKRGTITRAKALIKRQKEGVITPEEMEELAMMRETMPEAQARKLFKMGDVDVLPLNYIDTVPYHVEGPGRCVISYFKYCNHALRLGSRGKRGKLTSIIAALEPLYTTMRVDQWPIVREMLADGAKRAAWNAVEALGPFPAITAVVEAMLKHGITGDASVMLYERLRDTRRVGVDELTTILNAHNVGLNVYAPDDHCIADQIAAGYAHLMHVVPTGSHMHVLHKQPSSQKKREVVKVSPEAYDERCRAIKDTHNLVRWSSKQVVCGESQYDIEYDNLNKDLAAIYPVWGPYSDVETTFYDACGIRARKWEDTQVEGRIVNYDLSKSHFSILRDPTTMLPVPNAMSHYADYDGGELCAWHFYRVPVPPLHHYRMQYGDGEIWMYGQTLIELREVGGWTTLPTRVFVVARHVAGGPAGEYGDDRNAEVCNFVGVMARTETTEETYYRLSDDAEREAFIARYVGRYSIRGTGRDIVCITESMPKLSSALLAWLAIYSLQERNVWRLWRHKGCPAIRGVSADCLKIVDDSEDMGGTTTEGVRYKRELDQGYLAAIPPPVVTRDDRQPYVAPEWALNPPHALAPADGFELGKGLFVTGAAGMGKSYYVQNTIIPALTAAGLKYVVTSSTCESARGWGSETHTIQWWTQCFDGFNAVVERLAEYDYVIVDECTQLTYITFHILQRVRRRHQIAVIMMGDVNQCLNMEDTDYTVSFAFAELVDSRIMTMAWHEHARYTRAYYDFLQGYLDRRSDMDAARAWVRAHVAQMPLRDALALGPAHNLCWRHERYGKEVLGGVYSTIHSAQGRTISELYCVHELDTVTDYRIMYTALSRARDFTGVRIVGEDVPAAPAVARPTMAPHEALELLDYHYVAGKRRALVNRAVVRRIAKARGMTVEEPRRMPTCDDGLRWVYYETIDADKLAYIVRNPDKYPELLAKAQEKGKIVDPFAQARNMLANLQQDASGAWRLRVVYQQRSGRLYAVKGRGLQSVMKPVRHAIGGAYDDIDMVNAHPTILQWLCRRAGVACPLLDEYVNDRDAVLRAVCEDRDMAKTYILAVINGGTELRRAVSSAWVDAFAAEIERVDAALVAQHKDRYVARVAQREAEGVRHNHAASFVNVLMDEAENDILQTIVAKLKRDGHVSDDAVLVFDGLMVPRGRVDSAYLADLEADVLSARGIKISLAMKPMTQGLRTPTKLARFTGLRADELMLIDTADDEFPAIYEGMPVRAVGSHKRYGYAAGLHDVVAAVDCARVSLAGGVVMPMSVFKKGFVPDYAREPADAAALPGGAEWGVWPGVARGGGFCVM